VPLVTLEYVDKHSLLHRMNTVSKFVLYGVLLIMSQFWWDPRFLIVLTAMLMILVLVAKIPNSWLLPMYVIMIFGVIERSYTALFVLDPAIFKNFPSSLVSHVLIQVLPEGFPVLGRAALTIGSLIYLLSLLLRMWCSLLVTSLFLYTLNPSDVTQFLTRIKVPYKFVFAVHSAYHFFPIILRQTQTIISAQRLRGQIISKNPRRLLEYGITLFNPVIRQMVDVATTVTISTRLRAFGSGTPSFYRYVGPRFADWVVIVVSLVGMGLAVFALFTWNIGGL
jgi:energy-coupling factor transporter transmembrane protein EcfT